MAPRVWIITGASSGFGLQLTKTAAAAGDLVIAASRSPSKFNKHDLVPGITPMRLDHNESLSDVKRDMDAMFGLHGGRVDVVVNNAAYVQTGTLEETTPDETLKQMQANLLGPLNVYRAVLPHLRAQTRESPAGSSPTLVTIGSMNAWVPFNACNLYNISKAAVRSMGIGIAEEVRPFGIRHCLVEPGAFRTNLLDPGTNFASTKDGDATAVAATQSTTQRRIEAYREMNDATDAVFAGMNGHQPGDPVKACQIMFDLVTGQGGKELPEFLPLGSDAVTYIRQSAEKVLRQIDEMEAVARSADLA